MAEGIPVDQANVLTLKINDLERKVATLEAEKKALTISKTNLQSEVDKRVWELDKATEVYESIIDKMLSRLEDR